MIEYRRAEIYFEATDIKTRLTLCSSLTCKGGEEESKEQCERMKERVKACNKVIKKIEE